MPLALPGRARQGQGGADAHAYACRYSRDARRHRWSSPAQRERPVADLAPPQPACLPCLTHLPARWLPGQPWLQEIAALTVKKEQLQQQAASTQRKREALTGQVAALKEVGCPAPAAQGTRAGMHGRGWVWGMPQANAEAGQASSWCGKAAVGCSSTCSPGFRAAPLVMGSLPAVSGSCRILKASFCLPAHPAPPCRPPLLPRLSWHRCRRRWRLLRQM